MKPLRAAYSRVDALQLWQSVTMAMVRAEGPDFSARQMAILTAVYLDEQTALGARYLAGFADNICAELPEPRIAATCFASA